MRVQDQPTACHKQNTFSQSGNDSKWFLTKIIFQNRYVALETGLDPPTMGEQWLLKQFCLNHPVEHIQKQLAFCPEILATQKIL